MGKNFIKFRVFRVIPTFHSCRSKDPSTLPTNPVPSFLHRSSSTSTATTTHNKQLNLTTTTTQSSSRASIRRHVSSAISSARRGCLRSHPSPSPDPESSHTESSTLKLPSRCHFINKKLPKDYLNYDSTPPRRKIYNSAASDTDHENDVVFLPPPTKTRPGRKARRRRRNFQKVRFSTSSDSGIFSEDDDNNQERETETLVSTDSSSPKVNKKSKEREIHNKNTRSSFELPAPARLSAFMRKMAPCRAVVDGKVRESFAIVKRSEDPLDDFKRSMVEMVVEKQMFEERELEELLRCFLSLNSERHHEAIVRAFTEIWDGLFCQSSE